MEKGIRTQWQWCTRSTTKNLAYLMPNKTKNLYIDAYE